MALSHFMLLSAKLTGSRYIYCLWQPYAQAGSSPDGWLADFPILVSPGATRPVANAAEMPTAFRRVRHALHTAARKSWRFFRPLRARRILPAAARKSFGFSVQLCAKRSYRAVARKSFGFFRPLRACFIL